MIIIRSYKWTRVKINLFQNASIVTCVGSLRSPKTSIQGVELNKGSMHLDHGAWSSARMASMRGIITSDSIDPAYWRRSNTCGQSRPRTNMESDRPTTRSEGKEYTGGFIVTQRVLYTALRRYMAAARKKSLTSKAGDASSIIKGQVQASLSWIGVLVAELINVYTHISLWRKPNFCDSQPIYNASPKIVTQDCRLCRLGINPQRLRYKYVTGTPIL